MWIASLCLLFILPSFLFKFLLPVLSWPLSLQGQHVIESLSSGSLRRGEKRRIAGTWRCSAVGRLLTSLSSVAATTTVWSPSPTSSRLPLISPCASQSMPLMWWCPSFTYSIFDLSHFIQLNPVEVDSHRRGSPAFLLVLPPLFVPCSLSCSAKWSPEQLQEITFSLLCTTASKSVLIDR